MMKEYSAKNVTEALAVAAREKGVTESELVYEILEEKAGFLGMGSRATIKAYCFNDVVSFVETYIKQFFEGLQMEVEVDVTVEEQRIKVMLNAENNAILIGKGGETLRAMSIVVRNATSGYFKHRYDIIIDINNYKEERYSKISALAKRVAKSVVRTKTTATLDPMPSDERKVIHQLLSDMKYIRTESEGERGQRRLKIIYDPNKN